MGRIFEKRKHKMFARYNKMSQAFTKFGKEIAIAVKASGPDPEGNSRLRAIIANAKAANMPKANIEAAIQRANSKQDKEFEEIAYEGKGVHGVALIIETATDNPTRTVANLRSYFNKKGGQMVVSGSLDFLFERKGIFRISKANLNLEELELELIDFGMEEMEDDGEGNLILQVPFTEFGAMQKGLEDKKIEIINAELQRVPTTYVELTEEQEEEVNKLLEVIEEDDDVTNVWHNMK
ncbi:MAG: YebC/PmpR family DNA-binding transcriptional regulator [Bacteroidota bacterium]|jgi:YebC/PmpR family DNA-binding regulatory protein|nr:YebC/PmpR family DNA-binding transcriptional regulator [Sphingobacteriales bacterium]